MKKRKPKDAERQQQGQHDQAHSEKDTTKRHVYIEPGAQIDLVQGLRDEYSTANKQDTIHNQKQLFWARLSVFLIAGYAVITLLMYLANRDAATAAKSAAETARKALTLDQRPWMQTGEVTRPDIKVGTTPEWVLPLINSGKTPAFNVRHSIVIGVFGKNEPFKPRYTSDLTSANLTIFPGSPTYSLKAYFPNPLSIGDVKEIQTGANTKLFIYGLITYDDVFGAHHTTHFCYYVVPPTLRMAACDTYNDAD